MKSYGQFCGVARALDVIGDRWSLLIVRELMLGPRRYSELKVALPGVATNLLAARLRELEETGLIARANGRYEATERGQALRPVLRELVRFAVPMMRAGQGEDVARGHWIQGAAEALFDGADLTGVAPLRIAAHVEEEDVVLDVGVDRIEISRGTATDAAVRLSGSLEGVVGALSGMPTDHPVRIEGDVAALERLRARALIPA